MTPIEARRCPQLQHRRRQPSNVEPTRSVGPGWLQPTNIPKQTTNDKLHVQVVEIMNSRGMSQISVFVLYLHIWSVFCFLFFETTMNDVGQDQGAAGSTLDSSQGPGPGPL